MPWTMGCNNASLTPIRALKGHTMQRIEYNGERWTVQEVLGNGELLAINDAGHWDVLPSDAGRIA